MSNKTQLEHDYNELEECMHKEHNRLVKCAIMCELEKINMKLDNIIFVEKFSLFDKD